MSTILERMVGVLQRDRLSFFFKESHSAEDGCFYYALISCHNYLYPKKVLSRDIAEQISVGNKIGKGIVIRDVISEVKRLEPELKLRVDHIINHTDVPNKKLIRVLRPEDVIPIVDPPMNGRINSQPGVSTALVLLLEKASKDRGHFMSVEENPRFQNFGELMGGNAEFQRIKERYVGGLSFIIVKSDKV